RAACPQCSHSLRSFWSLASSTAILSAASGESFQASERILVKKSVPVHPQKARMPAMPPPTIPPPCADWQTTISLLGLAALWFVDHGGHAIAERLRIEQGRPMPDAELTEDYNPLEAGLWHTISFSKGCYIGQETIARLDTYKGVKQQLWGVRLSQPAPPGEPLLVGEEKVGKLTSLTETEAGLFGLAYVRTKAGGAGLTVTVGSGTGEIVDLPFLTRDRTNTDPE
ncbi:MAG: hypothetical protein HC840_21460, partial [Leptolyngbyaceae cyanobacterium RM2_2_4]|nr:hypothetical protein [Leptolyngbyaceae cyanobacterium RM2_2_4]